MGRKSLIVFLAFVFSLLFFVRDAHEESTRQEIIVSAAISLKNPLEEIGKIFEQKHTGVKVSFNFGASGDLKRQIEGGAPVDVFAPASPQELDELERKGRIIGGTRLTCAKNALVLIEPLHSEIRLRSFTDLKKEKVKRIAIGNPKTVPAGRYAREILKHYTLFDAVKDRLVFGEHARQVLDYVARGEVDAGIVYYTDALLRSGEVRIVQRAPEESHAPVLYPVAVVRETRSELLSREFAAFIASGMAEKIFKKYGFEPAGEERLP